MTRFVKLTLRPVTGRSGREIWVQAKKVVAVEQLDDCSKVEVTSYDSLYVLEQADTIVRMVEGTPLE